MKEFIKDNIKIGIYKDAVALGKAAADFAAQTLNDAIDQKGSANLILATGASQFTFLEALKKKEIAWDKVTVFHLDEYKGISDQHPASFRKYLKERILDEVRPKKIHFLNGDAENISAEIEQYENLLKNHEIDIACIGIGENGHIAFNDPPVANFNDPKLVKIVTLDEACRQQQLGEGWFPTLDDVPKEALTLTVPAIMRSKVVSCVVPDQRKAKAVHAALFEAIDTACPASILRKHANAHLLLDEAAASLLPQDS